MLISVPGLQPWRTSWTHPKTGRDYTIKLCRSATAGDAVLDACYDLVEQTSRRDYEASTAKWRPAEKRNEMREADLRYIVVREDVEKDKYADKDRLAAFTSLMPTHEEGHAVVYCYEIHLQPDLQSTGMGALLLGFQSIVASNLGPPVSKVMLTCFVSNTHALAFYRKQGFVTDATSPEARTLRGGKKFVPDYMILSRGVGAKVEGPVEGADDRKGRESSQAAGKALNETATG
ncbi:gnat family acetyltransferase [Ophiostoma piceae UAMH 11346]|uniref:N-alpha-acetyltransferase 40 n=1 Tax=Ophiostoma piceae (strain UAMH 11346) TaxID=1262450 RepID=S3CUR8_OPHP1|nr:gnat family acetyltransferase [Ophiostoma piceae UAMH 11346]